MKNRLYKFRHIIIFLLSVCCFIANASQLSISTNMPGNKIHVGDKFLIIIKAVNLNDGPLEISQKPPGCSILFNSESKNISEVNGVPHSVTQLALTCKADAVGKYKFGPVRIGKTASNVLTYEITSSPQQKGNESEATEKGNSGNNYSSQPPVDQNSGPVFIGKGNEEIFMRASISKSTAYEQEALVYTVKLYTSFETIKFLGATTAPKFDGFVIEESDDVSNSLAFENYNGKNYKTAVIARYIIFPQKPGKLRINGNTYTVSTDARSYYHDWYFQNMIVRRPVQLNVTPNDLIIDVKPLPTPIPADFIGGVGNFSVSSEMPQKKLSTNSGASLIYKISGTGNIKYLKMPELTEVLPSQFEVYSPKINVDAKVGATNVSGTATFDYILVPKETGEFKIPQLEFSYFNPETENYVQIKASGYDIQVGLGKESDKSQKVANFNPQLIPVGKLSRSVSIPYVSNIWYWFWFIVPVLIYCVSLAAYRKYQKDHENMQLLRSKKANQMAIRRLNKAYKYFKEDKDEEFYNEMLAALWGYLGDKLQMPVSELTRSNVGDEFKKHHIQESIFMPILNLIDECEYAKYTPVSRDANMRQLYDDAVNSLSEVENEFTKQQKQNAQAKKKNGDDEMY